MARLDLLLFHAYLLAEDPHEQEIMRPFPPLGLQYLVAWLRREGAFAVDWFDLTFAGGVGDFTARCADEDPRVVGLYGHTITRPRAAAMVRRCREEGRRVIAGGPDPVQYLDEYFDAGVEVVIIGEGEQTTEALLHHLRGNDWRWDWDRLAEIDGVAFRRDGVVIRTRPRALLRPIDRFPWPVRDRRDQEGYFSAWRARHGETALSMITSRGCPYHCTWCSKQVYGDTFRRRSPGDVLDELAALRERFNPDQIWFADDLFTLNKAWVHRFCAEMVRRGLQIPFYVIGRPETLDPELCAAMRAAGLFRMYLSAESGAQHILDQMRKEDTVQDIERAARLLRAQGVELGVFVMIGYPGETRADLDQTLRMLHRIAPDVSLVSVAHPMKGTAFYDAVADRVIAGSAAENGGRNRFVMDHPAEYYELAQRLIHAETGLVRRLRQGRLDGETARLALKAPVLRAGTWWWSRSGPPLTGQTGG
jgi:anaerobic magnesium-protoporphyrin IX monomethyl ester cyclase